MLESLPREVCKSRKYSVVQGVLGGETVPPEDGFSPLMFLLLSSNSVCTDFATCFDAYISYYNPFINLGVFPSLEKGLSSDKERILRTQGL